MREGGLEPPRLSAQEPKSCVYANFTTLADLGIQYIGYSLSLYQNVKILKIFQPAKMKFTTWPLPITGK